MIQSSCMQAVTEDLTVARMSQYLSSDGSTEVQPIYVDVAAQRNEMLQYPLIRQIVNKVMRTLKVDDALKSGCC
jgi:hypothetical protein